MRVAKEVLKKRVSERKKGEGYFHCAFGAMYSASLMCLDWTDFFDKGRKSSPNCYGRSWVDHVPACSFLYWMLNRPSPPFPSRLARSPNINFTTP